MSRTIAFDLGTTYGWADDKGSGYGMINRDKRVFSFYNFVLDKLFTKREGLPYTTIAFEDAKFQLGNAIYPFNAQKAVLQLVAESQNLEFIGYSPMTIKKIFTGKGNATKDDMLKKAGVQNHNEADAIAVLFTHNKSK